MSRREFLMLGKPFVFGKYNIGGWALSEKIDGIRAFWDGGLSTGLRCTEVPYANTEKHHRYVNEKFATGLYTRYGQAIQAPEWFVTSLPKIPLDGELTMGRGTWQELTSCVKQQIPDDRWRQVRYMVFDSPQYTAVFADGRINNPPNFKKELRGTMQWVQLRQQIVPAREMTQGVFISTQRHLADGPLGPYASRLEQLALPMGMTAAEAVVREKCDKITSLGGEGVMLRNPYSIWEPVRSSDLFKVKAQLDAEANVIGYKYALPTDPEKSRTGATTDKLLGLMGSLIVSTATGIQFELSGFTDSERILSDSGFVDNALADSSAFTLGKLIPGQVAPSHITSRQFPRGSSVTYKYRELSDGGVPKEARFHRKDLGV